MSPVVTRAAAQPDRRRDIQGLRAVAVALVVGYHLWPDAVRGGFVGVDIFFVISGCLITRMLLTRPPRRGRDLATFWARRIRRLMPAALLVLAATLLASRLLAPETQWLRTAKEAMAAAVYGENWMLVASATDYLAPSTAPTPVQHFWSLAVEEQFYIVWPVLILVTALLVRGMRRGAVVFAARFTIGAVLVASFVYGLAATSDDAAAAYFQTPTRVWELAAGGMVATWSPAVRAPRTRALAAWLAIGVAVASAWMFTAETPWPGWAAAVPVVAAAVFLRANADGPWSPVRVLRLRAVQWTGDTSYSIYLWHWPILVLLPFALDRDLGWPEKAGVVVGTLVLAGLTLTHVENRWRRSRPGVPLRRPFQWAVVGALGVGVIAGAQVYGLHVTEQRIEAAQATTTGGSCFGAAALERGAKACPVEPDADVVPLPSASAADRPALFSDGCMDTPPFAKTRSCTFGDGPVRIALVGNSHAAHWLPALQELQKTHDFSVTTFLVTACTTVDAPLDWSTPERAAGCAAWRDRTLDETKGKAFDLVITSQRAVHPVVGYDVDASYGPWRTGFESYLQQWTDAGTNVLVIRDTPFPGANVPECVAEHPTEQLKCSGSRSSWLLPDPLAAAAEQEGVPVVDLTRLFCGPSRCDGVNGGVMTYFDGSHLTRTYARSVAPFLEPAITAALQG
ncbi:MAG: hypothetical protein JWP31_1576 [Aeromicrobium sp.]|nr:hypothetical protein [Aeromicrobium sp.]